MVILQPYQMPKELVDKTKRLEKSGLKKEARKKKKLEKINVNR